MTAIAGNPYLLWPYVAILVIAAFQDFRSLRISNLLSVSLLVVGAAAVVLAVPAGDWWQYLASFAIVLGIGIVLFARGWLGGGDVKLFAASAIPYSLFNLLWLVSAVTIFGGVVALLLLFLRAFLPPGLAEVWGIKGLAKGSYIPYGLAIAAGAIAAALVADADRDRDRSIPLLEQDPFEYIDRG